MKLLLQIPFIKPKILLLSGLSIFWHAGSVRLRQQELTNKINRQQFEKKMKVFLPDPAFNNFTFELIRDERNCFVN